MATAAQNVNSATCVSTTASDQSEPNSTNQIALYRANANNSFLIQQAEPNMQTAWFVAAMRVHNSAHSNPSYDVCVLHFNHPYANPHLSRVLCSDTENTEPMLHSMPVALSQDALTSNSYNLSLCDESEQLETTKQALHNDDDVPMEPTEYKMFANKIAMHVCLTIISQPDKVVNEAERFILNYGKENTRNLFPNLKACLSFLQYHNDCGLLSVDKQYLIPKGIKLLRQEVEMSGSQALKRRVAWQDRLLELSSLVLQAQARAGARQAQALAQLNSLAN